jgi:hypothetical protein
MRKIEVGRFVTILANIGVISGIVFLGYELRQNNQQLELDSRVQADSRRNAVIGVVIGNPYLVDLLGKETEQLNQQERDKLVLLGIMMLMNWEEQYRDVIAGRMSRAEAIRAQHAIYSRARLNYGVPLAWQTYKVRADPGFIEWMQQHILGP